MPFLVYGVNPGVNQATSGSANTEVDAHFVAAGTGRSTSVQFIQVLGKGAALTAISGIAFRMKRWTTASTSGTALTPRPRDLTAQAAKTTAAYGPTEGSVSGAYQLGLGCGAAGPGGWSALNHESMPMMESGSGDSLDLYSASGTASLNFEIVDYEIVEQ